MKLGFLTTPMQWLLPAAIGVALLSLPAAAHADTITQTCPCTYQDYQQDLQTINTDILTHPFQYAGSSTAQSDYTQGLNDGNNGVAQQLMNNTAAADADFLAAGIEFNGVAEALGLPPITNLTSCTTPEPTSAAFFATFACLGGILLWVRRHRWAPFDHLP